MLRSSNEIEVIAPVEPFDQLRPSRGFPKLFLPRRAGMQNNEGLADVPIVSERIGFFVRRLGQLQMQRGGNIPDAERFEQRQIVVRLCAGRAYGRWQNQCKAGRGFSTDRAPGMTRCVSGLRIRTPEMPSGRFA